MRIDRPRQAVLPFLRKLLHEQYRYVAPQREVPVRKVMPPPHVAQ